MDQTGEITELLASFGKGDAENDAALATLVYEDLRHHARRLFAREGPHTIQPTVLVHEAFERLIKVDVDWNDRRHFFALATRMMKRLMINHVKSKQAQKRGGDAHRVTLDEQMVPSTGDAGLLELTQALEALAAIDKRKAQLIEFQYFGGLSVAEMAKITGVSEPTVGRDLRFARAWLKDELMQNHE